MIGGLGRIVEDWRGLARIGEDRVVREEGKGEGRGGDGCLVTWTPSSMLAQEILLVILQAAIQKKVILFPKIQITKIYIKIKNEIK